MKQESAPPRGPGGVLPPDIARMPRLSAQQKLDEERGITSRECITGALRVSIGGPEWLVNQVADVILLTLKKMGFKIVPMERGDYE